MVAADDNYSQRSRDDAGQQSRHWRKSSPLQVAHCCRLEIVDLLAPSDCYRAPRLPGRSRSLGWGEADCCWRRRTVRCHATSCSAASPASCTRSASTRRSASVRTLQRRRCLTGGGRWWMVARWLSLGTRACHDIADSISCTAARTPRPWWLLWWRGRQLPLQIQLVTIKKCQ